MNDLMHIQKPVTETEIKQSAKTFAGDFLMEFYCLDLVVLAKKLEVFAKELRTIGEEQAYADCGQGKMIVAGATCSTTRPSNVYEYSESIRLAEEQIAETRKAEDEHIKALKRLEEVDGTAKVIDIKKGQLKVSIPK